jgi:hypothetical protein
MQIVEHDDDRHKLGGALHKLAYRRPPYGYQLTDAGPTPEQDKRGLGRRARRLEPDPRTAPVVAWIFAQRLAGHSMTRIARTLNDAGIPCPSAADPGEWTAELDVRRPGARR